MLTQVLTESNKENIESFVVSKKRGRQKKGDFLSQPKPSRKKTESKRNPRTTKFLSQPQLPPSPPGSGLDYTKFQKKMESLPTELEVQQIQRKTEIEHFKKVCLNYNAGLKTINQELGIESPKVSSEFLLNQSPTVAIKPEVAISPKSRFRDTDYNMPILSPPPPSVAPSFRLKMQDVGEVATSDQFILEVDDLQELGLFLKVGFEKILKAVISLRNNEKLIEEEEDDDDEVIPSSQSPSSRRDFWRQRILQRTQGFIGK